MSHGSGVDVAGKLIEDIDDSVGINDGVGLNDGVGFNDDMRLNDDVGRNIGLVTT